MSFSMTSIDYIIVFAISDFFPHSYKYFKVFFRLEKTIVKRPCDGIQCIFFSREFWPLSPALQTNFLLSISIIYPLIFNVCLILLL